MSLSLEIELDVLKCALAEALRQEANYGPTGPSLEDPIPLSVRDAMRAELHREWVARVVRLRKAIVSIQGCLSAEQDQAMMLWSPP